MFVKEKLENVYWVSSIVIKPYEGEISYELLERLKS